MRFFAVPELKALFFHFAAHKNLKAFVEQRYKDKDEDYAARVICYVQKLRKEAELLN
jgi:hypothetical protein